MRGARSLFSLTHLVTDTCLPGSVDTSVNIFGFRSSIPLGVAPTAMQCLAHSDGELGTAGACRKANVAMGLSSFATKTLEEVAQASGHIPNVLQLYLFEEKEHSIKLIQRAKKAGFKAVFLTVDTPFLGRRNLEIRNQFKLPAHFKIANFAEDDPMQPETEGNTPKRPQLERKKSEAGYLDDDGKRVAPTGPSESPKAMVVFVMHPYTDVQQSLSTLMHQTQHYLGSVISTGSRKSAAMICRCG